MNTLMMKLTLALVVTTLFATNAIAQTACAPRDTVVGRLAERYGETRQSMGLGTNNAVIEVFASSAGSWTITVTTANGTTCLIASGQAFEEMAENLPAAGDDA